MTALPSESPDSTAAPRPARAVTACTHCGLPVPRGLIEQGSPHQFCCQGCRAVFAIIHGEGLDDYYSMRRSLETDKARVPDAVSAERIDYDAYDDPAFAEAFSTVCDDGTTTATLSVDGLHCAACVWLIERLQRVVPAVISAQVHYGRATVDIRWRTGDAAFSDIARGLHALGYPASPPRGASQDERRRADARAQLIRIGVAGALAGNIMLVAVALYAGVFDGMDHATLTFFRYVSAALGVLTLAWPGRVFFRGALGALRARAPHLDLPIALALLVGGVWGVANTLRGTGEIYFDSLAALVFLLLVGRFIQSQQQRRAADALDLLLTLTPSLVRVVRADGSGTDQKPVEAVQLEDLAEILPGETIPVDGVVADGASDLDQSILTGESAPVPVRPDEPVFAGAVNLSGVLRVRTTAVGETTRAARLMQLVADAAERKAPIVQTADRLAGWFVAIVATLALVTGVAWAVLPPQGSLQTAIEHATALLIVTCPCALGLATPLVLSATIGRLARAGVLVKGGVQLERLASPRPGRPGLAVFDKTGTVTTGAMSVARWTVDDDTARLVRTLEAQSTHPIARAIADSGPRDDDAPTDTVNTQGLGLTGTVGGVRLAVGSDEHLRALGIEIPDAIEAWAREAAEAGETPVLIAADGIATGGVSLTDTPRDDAPGLIEAFTRAGWSVALLSGDDPRVVRRTAERLGIDPAHATGRVTPEGKLEAIRERVRAHADARLGPVVMIGDGVNDAAALAAADVGIAVQGGADASLDAADIFIQKGGLTSIARLLDASSGAIRRIRLCIGASLFYNTTAAALAMAGLVHPLLAAVLMPLSSLTVVSIAASGRLARATVR
jgi:Cu2+-exporting ATPase